MDLSNYPDHWLISNFLVAPTSEEKWAIGKELDKRYEEVKEELEEYQYYELDEEFMNY